MVFQSKISVLVNGSPTKEFTVERGLRQGDPLSPFLFVIVAEGLTALMKKAIDIWEYEGFLINGKCVVDILQFADDTLMIGEGINVSNNLLEAASSLLSCKVEGKLFTFLGILVGSNPRRYGDICLQVTHDGDFVSLCSSQSTWWKDILSLGKNSSKDAIVNNCYFKVGKGYTTSFWPSKWLLDSSLKVAFPLLFVASLLKNVSLQAEVGAAMCSPIGRDSVS
ncbi:uncharacterized protein LOC131624375 [Vicia villosa]|uniref:uncharacterized protein LOC131624375 n=1 Tax=Vicia villosa TaxID=3911 RepID=UPI00273B6F5E|nr:uncharacterized protein LOC131624375 [Vicia villosa]